MINSNAKNHFRWHARNKPHKNNEVNSESGSFVITDTDYSIVSLTKDKRILMKNLRVIVFPTAHYYMREIYSRLGIGKAAEKCFECFDCKSFLLPFFF